MYKSQLLYFKELVLSQQSSHEGKKGAKKILNSLEQKLNLIQINVK